MPRRVEGGLNLTQPIYVLIFTLLIKTDLLFVSYVYSLDFFYANVSSLVIRRKGKRISNISYLLIHTGGIRGNIRVSGVIYP